MVSRRDALMSVVAAGIGVTAAAKFGFAAAAAADSVSLPIANGERPLVAYPGKRPLIRLTTRPPQLETPFSVFDEGVITPNDAFFVRYHLARIPLNIDPDSFRLSIQGKVDTPLSLSLSDLKTGFEPIELTAVNQCAGNGRGFFEPRVPGGQLTSGAMGNARWKGVPRRRRDDDPLARQMLGKRLSRRPLALEGFDDGRGRCALRRQLVLGRVGLGVLQLHLQLVDEPLLAFRTHALERAAQLFDLQPQPRDQRLGARRGRMNVRKVRFRPRRARLAVHPRRPLGEDQRVRSEERRVGK